MILILINTKNQKLQNQLRMKQLSLHFIFINKLVNKVVYWIMVFINLFSTQKCIRIKKWNQNTHLTICCSHQVSLVISRMCLVLNSLNMLVDFLVVSRAMKMTSTINPWKHLPNLNLKLTLAIKYTMISTNNQEQGLFNNYLKPILTIKHTMTL